jgi:DNA-binding CsgD family transcriptional regulator
MKSHAGHLSATSVGGGQAVIALCLGLVLLLFGAELVAPPDLSLGVVVLIPILAAWTLLGPGWGTVVLVLAAATRVAAVFIGDVPSGLANVEIVSYVVAAGVIMLTLRREKRRSPAKVTEVEQQGLPPSPAPEDHLPATVGAIALTTRERQVLLMTMHGLTAAQIGERLFIGRRTVESHLDRAYGKLGVRSKRDFIARVFDSKASADQRR